MPLDAKPSQRLSRLFLDQPCWLIEPLADELNYSILSVRRFLAEVGYFSSFTHNGRWYTLRSIPRFGPDGLWFYSDIGFSRAGTLTNTLVDLATRSATGLSAEQLGAKLRVQRAEVAKREKGVVGLVAVVLVLVTSSDLVANDVERHERPFFLVVRDLASAESGRQL